MKTVYSRIEQMRVNTSYLMCWQINKAGFLLILQGLAERGNFRQMQVDVIRISPVAQGTFDCIRQFRQAIDGELLATTASDYANGYWVGEAGMNSKINAEQLS